jgi:hypothetical protein
MDGSGITRNTEWTERTYAWHTELTEHLWGLVGWIVGQATCTHRINGENSNTKKVRVDKAKRSNGPGKLVPVYECGTMASWIVSQRN